jgi:hypothetical protein
MPFKPKVAAWNSHVNFLCIIPVVVQVLLSPEAASVGLTHKVNQEWSLGTSWILHHHSKAFPAGKSLCIYKKQRMNEDKGIERVIQIWPTMDHMAPSWGWDTLLFIHLNILEAPNKGSLMDSNSPETLFQKEIAKWETHFDIGILVCCHLTDPPNKTTIR